MSELKLEVFEIFVLFVLPSLSLVERAFLEGCSAVHWWRGFDPLDRSS